MIKCFHIPGVEFDDTSDDHYAINSKTEEESEAEDHCPIEQQMPSVNMDPTEIPLRITPSKHYTETIGHQSIPFYYHLSNSIHSLHRYWNYHLWKTGSTDAQLALSLIHI